jgi:hypothetical protein
MKQKIKEKKLRKKTKEIEKKRKKLRKKNERNERTLQCSSGGGDKMSGEVRTALESGGQKGDERGGETHE